jgi:PAS domain S-box-containing protein
VTASAKGEASPIGDAGADPAARERLRLAALDRYRVLDSARETGFDDLAELAATVCETPIAVVNLVGDRRQWFKAEVGLGVSETPLETSFCTHALLEQDFLLVEDATLDARFACNPLVTGEPGLRFYAGALLKTADGLAIGTLCVLDYVPRTLDQRQQSALRQLAGQVMAQLELRRALLEREEARQSLERQIIERAQARAMAWKVSPDLMGALNDRGYFEMSNPAWLTVLGWTEEEVAATPIFEFLHPDDVERTRRVFELTQLGQPAIRFPNRYRCKDGSYRWISWIGVPEDGFVYCTGRDITEERDQAATLAATEEALRQSQKLEAIGQLTGGVAHDFNNLLTVIRGSVDLLRRPELSPEKRSRYIDAIGDTADRAAKLTGQLLAFARRQALSPKLFDVGASLREVAVMVQTLTGSRVVLDLDVPEDTYFIEADRSQFDTAIVNMAINARDAMRGEGRLTIAAGPLSGIPEIRTHPPVAGDFIAVTLADTGAGIAADQIDRVFEPFFTTKGIGEGTGLGLSQAIGFAKQSGGDIRVQSVAGQGTTFTLYLPRAYPQPAGHSPPAEEEPDSGGDGRRILIVEDNDQVGQFATEALKELGYVSILAGDAMAALAELAADSSRFDIVFSDVVMPGMSGLELGAEIRRLYPDVPVILTSGYSHVLAQNGSHGFELLHKPYSIEQLSRVLRKAIVWRNTRRACAADPIGLQ